jgi:hypothetical protein
MVIPARTTREVQCARSSSQLTGIDSAGLEHCNDLVSNNGRRRRSPAGRQRTSSDGARQVRWRHRGCTSHCALASGQRVQRQRIERERRAMVSDRASLTPRSEGGRSGVAGYGGQLLTLC